MNSLIQNIQAWFGQLSQRERRLVTLAGSAALIFAVFMIFFSFSNSASSYRRRTEQKLEDLEKVQTLAASFREAETERQNVERQLSASNVQLISYLEEKGVNAGLDIRTLNPKGDVPIGDGKIVESAVEVTLTDVRLDKLVAFLSDLERGPGVVKVKRLRLEPRAENESITAWATIATYSLKK